MRRAVSLRRSLESGDPSWFSEDSHGGSHVDAAVPFDRPLALGRRELGPWTRRATIALVRSLRVGLALAPLLFACSEPGIDTVWELVSHPVESVRLYRLMTAFEAAAERKDPDALAAVAHVDAEHWGLVSGRRVQGREALRELFAAEFAGEAGTEDMATRLVALRFVSDDVVLGDITVLYEDYRLGDRVWPEYREHTFVVLSRRDGAWKIAATGAGGHDAR